MSRLHYRRPSERMRFGFAWGLNSDESSMSDIKIHPGGTRKGGGVSTKLSLLTWEKDLPVDLKPPPHSVHGLASNASTASSNASSTASSSTEGEVDMPSAIGPTSVR